MQARYEGVEWRAEASWGCNQKQSPLHLAAVDDVGLHPMELMFVRVEHWGVQLQYPSMRSAVQYSSWMVRALSAAPVRCLIHHCACFGNPPT